MKTLANVLKAWAVVAGMLLCGPAASAAPAGAAADPLPALTNTSVSIPWQELRALLTAARRPGAPAPPVDHVLSPADYEVAVADGLAKVTGRCEVDVLAERWVLVPLGPASAGLRKVTADGASCPVVLQGPQLHALLNGKGKRKLEITLELPVAAAAVAKLALPLVPSPVVTVTTTLDRPGLDVTAEDAAAVRTSEKAGKTVAVSSHRGGATAVLSWRARPVRPKALPTRLYAESETLIRLDDRLARSTSTVRLQVVHEPLETVRIELDPAAAVLSVGGDGVAGWLLADQKGARAVEVRFAPPAAGERTITLVTERELPEAGGDLAVRLPRVVGALRDRGLAAASCGEGWQVGPAGAEGAERIGVSELPASVRSAGGQGLELAWRYREAPASVSLSVSRLEPKPARLYADTATLVTVEGGRIRCRATIGYDILHAGVESLRIGLPDGVDVLGVTGATLRQTQVLTEGKARTLVADLKDIARGAFELTVAYERRLPEGEAAPAVPLLTHPGAAADHGSVGIEVRGGLEVRAAAEGAERVDVKELDSRLWASAGAPLLMGFRYARPGAKITLGITRHEDVDVLVAMSDVCEAATTLTPDGKAVTKMMYVLRNNRKQFMRLKLPAGAEVWSAFVHDRPVTPARTADGDVLVPLVKSDEEDGDRDDEHESYAERRDRRRREGLPGLDRARNDRVRRIEKLRELDDAPRDLKPYDVEIVFVLSGLKLADRGEVRLALPKCDIPVGQLAWAVFLPSDVRVLLAEGNLKEVGSFSLPFRHFADAEYARRAEALAQQAKALEQLAELAQAQDAAKRALAEAAKAQGPLPVRVELPIAGQISRYEKLLVVDEAAALTLTYRRKTN